MTAAQGGNGETSGATDHWGALLRAVWLHQNASCGRDPALMMRTANAVSNAARDHVLAVSALPESDRPFGWKPVVRSEDLFAAVSRLKDDADEVGPGEYATGLRAGLNQAVAAIKLAIQESSAPSSAAGTGPRFAEGAGR